jgi:predicted phosphodiesterase
MRASKFLCAATIVFLATSACSSLHKSSVRHPASSDDPYAFTFFNVSDAHVVEPTAENSWRMTKDSVAILEDTLKHVDAEKPDMVLFSGDVIEGKFYGMKSLKLASERMNKLSVPWLVVSGNHDARYLVKEVTIDEFNKNEFYKEFTGHGPSVEQPYWRYDVPGKKISIVGLDATKEGTHEGYIDQAQKDWLEATLTAIPADRFVIIMIHHPLVVFNTAILDPDKAPVLKIFVTNNHAEIRPILERHKNVHLVISGHNHSSEYALVNGIHYVGTPSINSWPCRYSKFVISHDKISYSHLPISDPAKVQEAYDNIIRADSTWIKFFKTEQDLKNYFLHGPMDGEFSY